MTDLQNVNTYIGGGKKQASISAIRFIAMCSIVACHICQFYGNEMAWWLNVGVQVFLFLSGNLYGSKDIKEPFSWILRQFKKILVPYYVFLLLAIIAYISLCPSALNSKQVIGAILTVDTIKGLEHLWFIPCILLCYLLTPILQYVRDKICKEISATRFLLLSCIIFGIYATQSMYLWAYFRPWVLACYIFGYFFATYNQGKNNSESLKILFVVSALALVLNIVFTYLKYYRGFTYGQFTDFCHMVLGIMLSLWGLNLFKTLHHNNFFAFSDKISYEVYLVHHIFILSPLTLLNVTDNGVLNIIIIIAVILTTSYLLNVASQIIIRLTKNRK